MSAGEIELTILGLSSDWELLFIFQVCTETGIEAPASMSLSLRHFGDLF
jgi:hypothetical protein